MKTSLRSQLLGAAAVAVLAGCNAAQSLAPAVGTGVGPAGVTNNRGARFSAAYSGTFNTAGDCSLTKTLTYSGTGNAKFLHASSEQLSLTWDCGTGSLNGSATLTSVHHPADSITASAQGTGFTNACNSFTLSYTVTGGSGRFRHASGSGTIALTTASSDCSSFTYSDKWRGTLKL